MWNAGLQMLEFNVMARLITLWTLLVSTLFGFLPAVLAHEPLVPAPYQVDGVIRFKNDRHRLGPGLDLNPPIIVVDLGTAQGPHPAAKKFARMTFLGSAGVGFGMLQDIQKHCDYLCGDSGEECHYAGLFALEGPMEALGTPLAAIPGTQALTEYRALPARTVDPAALSLGGQADFTALVWAPYGADGPMARIESWDGAGARLGLDLRWRSGEVFSGDGEQCTVGRVDALTQLNCNPVALLLDGSRPLLLSYPDYNIAAAEVVSTIELGSATLYLVRLGLKAQTVFGLLYRDAVDWRGLFRPRDHALLC